MDIAFLGIGLMGKPMAERLIDADHRLFLFNRTPAKTIPLAEKGATVVENSYAAIEQAECVVTMLSDYPAICDMLFSKGDFDWKGKTVIQMGTVLPSESCALKNRIEAHHGFYVESPVLGSRDKAEAADLIVLVGATPQQFQQLLPLLKSFGPDPRYIGEVGKASALKLALNQLIISLICAFSLSFGIVERSGVDMDEFMAVLRESSLYAPTFDKKLPRIRNRDFNDPNFPIRHMLKDVNLILSQAHVCGLEDSVLQAVKKLLVCAVNAGLEDQDYSGVFKMITP